MADIKISALTALGGAPDTGDLFELVDISGGVSRSVTLSNIRSGIVGSGFVNADIAAAAGIVDTKLATISTAGKVSNSATTAASANTASAIVARDGSGNFVAGTITAALTGNASTATALATARNINGVAFDGTGNITVTAAAGTLSGATLASGVTASSLTSVGTLTSLTSSGTITGNLFSGSGASLTALNASNLSSGTVATARLGTGTADNTTYLRGDGTWATPGGGGTVTGTGTAGVLVRWGSTSGIVDASAVVNADISATAGIVDTKLATIATAGKVSNSATTAASANTASAIVARDSSGNFIAGTITAALTGNASTATALANARNINGVAFDGTGNITVTAAAGTLTGTTLNSSVVTTSITSVGTLSGLTMGGTVAGADQEFQRMLVRGAAWKKAAPSISSGTLALDYRDGPYHYVTLNGNVSTITWSNWPGSGVVGVQHIRWKANGSTYTITSTMNSVAGVWDGGTAPTPPITNNKVQWWTVVSADALGEIDLFLNATSMQH